MRSKMNTNRHSVYRIRCRRRASAASAEATLSAMTDGLPLSVRRYAGDRASASAPPHYTNDLTAFPCRCAFVVPCSIPAPYTMRSNSRHRAVERIPRFPVPERPVSSPQTIGIRLFSNWRDNLRLPVRVRLSAVTPVQSGKQTGVVRSRFHSPINTRRMRPCM